MTDFNGIGVAMILKELDKVKIELIKRVEEKHREEVEASEEALESLFENLDYDKTFSNAYHACEEFIDAAEARKKRDREIDRIKYFFLCIYDIIKNENKLT